MPVEKASELIYAEPPAYEGKSYMKEESNTYNLFILSSTGLT